ncbi:MAG: type II toxin-antitoxin system VapB family antitoxin [Alphaproteobacteria bacterium]|nr:type II toxin-antitoxin system VapB family antitoxin [Alphaproteobacteria bacterium]
MSLNIKSDEAHALARKLADHTGESMTTAVTEALRERLARIEKTGLVDRLMEIGKEFSSRMSKQTKKFDIDKELYDKNGLPK